MPKRTKEVKKKRSSRIPLHTPLRYLFGVNSPGEGRVYYGLSRAGSESLSDILKAERRWLLSIRNFGVVSLVVFYRKLADIRWLERAKSWPPHDEGGTLYIEILRALDERWPEWEEFL